jgi:maltose alpha-D-glucosyltransferase/alpha-amylase
VVTLHNLSDRRVQVSLPVEGIPPELTPLSCDDNERNPCRAEDPIALGAYGFRWFRADGERR